MVNVIIPVYNGLKYIDTALESLVKQKQSKDDFVVTIVQDLDGLDYSGIIEHYINLGLHISFIKSETRLKQGLARQLGIDSNSEAEFVMFLDQDDYLSKDAIQVLYNTITFTGDNLVFSNFVMETKDDSELVNYSHQNIYTQLHGKIFRKSYLDEYDIRFSSNLRYSEDSCFNLKAYYCSSKVSYIDRTTYTWCYNAESESKKNELDYCVNMYPDYVKSQVEGIMHVRAFEGNRLSNDRLAPIIAYLYEVVALQTTLHFPDSSFKEALCTLGKQPFMKDFFEDDEVLKTIATTIHGGIVFFEVPVMFNISFRDWVKDWYGDIKEFNLFEEEVKDEK